MALEPLEALTEALRRDEYPNVHAVLLATAGQLVYELLLGGNSLE